MKNHTLTGNTRYRKLKQVAGIEINKYMQSSIHHGVVLKTCFMYSIHENHQLLEYRFNRTGLFIAYHYYIRDIPVCLLLTCTALSSFFSA